MNNKYPTVNYIGNKEKVADWIIDCLPIKSGIVLDLFCGGCSMSYELKNRGFTVLSNDALFSNFVLAKAIIENSKDTLSKEDYINISVDAEAQKRSYEKIKFLSDKVYFDDEVKELAYLINVANEIPENKKYIFLSLLRRSMIRKIPYSRMNIKWEEIKKFRDEDYSYKKYGRYRHYHNIPFIEHINLNLNEYNAAVIKGKSGCKALCFDALDCITNLTQKVDLIYFDPPYPSTMNNYNAFYGYFDKMFFDEVKIKLDLTDKKTFITNFKRIVAESLGKTKYIAISLNNKCYPSVDVLKNELSEYVETSEIFKKEHVYKVTGKENKHTNYEILLVCKMKER